MKISLFVYLSLISLSFAQDHGHALGAHEHGFLKVEMAVEKSSAEIEIDGPAESFLGFEYAPKTKEEVKIFQSVQNKWTKNFESLFKFDKSLQCQLESATLELEQDNHREKNSDKKQKSSKKVKGVHSDVKAQAKVTCSSNLSGSLLTVYLKKEFKNIKKINLTILGSETKSVEIKDEVFKTKI